ncbi:hypothetical protein CCACVL1_06362 [Corchorus capsularis]|uniref:Uncharacterized protein n=1 Tax=Corchorus capsularis TaxID=210143 RepID=A0A1R3JG13_COCAP|nr:hypothetical protein CCACVL1_06362 [Corchorus capsularis]
MKQSLFPWTVSRLVDSCRKTASLIGDMGKGHRALVSERRRVGRDYNSEIVGDNTVGLIDQERLRLDSKLLLTDNVDEGKKRDSRMVGVLGKSQDFLEINRKARELRPVEIGNGSKNLYVNVENELSSNTMGQSPSGKKINMETMSGAKETDFGPR